MGSQLDDIPGLWLGIVGGIVRGDGFYSFEKSLPVIHALIFAIRENKGCKPSMFFTLKIFMDSLQVITWSAGKGELLNYLLNRHPRNKMLKGPEAAGVFEAECDRIITELLLIHSCAGLGRKRIGEGPRR